MARNSIPMEEIKRRVRRSITKKPQTAAELVEKINTKFDANHSPRGIGRTLGVMVKEGEIAKHETRVPGYSKV